MDGKNKIFQHKDKNRDSLIPNYSKRKNGGTGNYLYIILFERRESLVQKKTKTKKVLKDKHYSSEKRDQVFLSRCMNRKREDG